MSDTSPPQKVNPVLAQLRPLRLQLTTLVAQVDAAIATVEATEADVQRPIATSKNNPVGNPHTFRRILKTSTIKQWKHGRGLACYWDDFLAELQSQELTPKPPKKPPTDPLEAALDDLEVG